MRDASKISLYQIASPKILELILFPTEKCNFRDLPLKFHPAAVRVSGFCTPSGAGGATGDRRSWSGLRSRSPVAVNVAA